MENEGFFKSNLFIFLLGQGFAFICWLCIFAYGWGTYSERFSGHERRITSLESLQKRVDEFGTTYIQNTKQLSEIEARIERMEKETSHFDVMEFEHRRLTEEVEKLKDGKK